MRILSHTESHAIDFVQDATAMKKEEVLERWERINEHTAHLSCRMCLVPCSREVVSDRPYLMREMIRPIHVEPSKHVVLKTHVGGISRTHEGSPRWCLKIKRRDQIEEISEQIRTNQYRLPWKMH